MKTTISLLIIAMYFLPIQSFWANLHIQTCEKWYIGYEYNPKLDKKCRILWNMWTKQILSNMK